MGNVCCEEPTNIGQLKVSEQVVVYDPIEYQVYKGPITLNNLVKERFTQIKAKLASIGGQQVEGVIKKPPHKQTHHNFIYEGTWKNDVPEGFGKILFENGEYFEGEFKNGKANGEGILIFDNGDYYHGQIQDNKASGKGIYIGSLINYDGEWENSKPTAGTYKLMTDETIIEVKKNGEGEIKWVNGNYYSGEIKNQKPHGLGLMKFANGNQYDGSWRNGICEGHGKFVWTNGKVYIGQYVNGVKEGLGDFIYGNGRKYKGMWKNGKQNGPGKLYENDNLVFQGIFRDGAPTDEKVEEVDNNASQLPQKLMFDSKPLSDIKEENSSLFRR